LNFACFELGDCLSCSPASSGGDYSPVNVRRIVDGDTIEIVFQGKKEHVRLVGVDT
jgi:endonuclease YncB( thermonuclease family)